MNRISLNKKVVPKTQIPDNKSQNKKIQLDFSYFCFKGIKTKNFTNFFKDNTQAYRYQLNFFHKFIPEVTKKTFIELGHNQTTHCHEINEKDKVLLINQILKEYTETYRDFKLPTYEGFGDQFYQLSTGGGVRIIGFRYGDIFFILFVDCYHLIFPSQKHNSTDYHKYCYNEFDCYFSNIKLIDFQDLALKTEKCLECDVLRNITE